MNKPPVQLPDNSVVNWGNETEKGSWTEWKGEGDPPKYWWAINPKTKENTKIYRSYADYVG